MTPLTPEADRRFALRLARQAGEILRQAWDDPAGDRIRMKGLRDPVTEIDTASEAFLVEQIRHHRPGDGILAEEQVREGLELPRVWILDPLDGTVNFTHRHPFVGVSVALLGEGQVQAAAVHAPMLHTSWSAARGGGCHEHKGDVSRTCRVSTIDRPAEALVATGFPYVRETSAFNNLAEFERLFLQVRGLRRCGVASIDLALVAAGVYDAFWEPHLAPYDVAAGSLLITEAGGRVTDYRGGDAWLFGRNIVATNGPLHAFMRDQMPDDFDPDRLA